MTAHSQSRWLSSRNMVFGVALLLLLALSYWWRLRLLGEAFNYDEGIHLILAQLWAAGYTPYQEIFVSYPPLFMWSLGLPWRLFEQASALQVAMASYSLLGVVGLVYLGSVYHSRLAGLAAGALLSFAPTYFEPSIQVMGEVPSIGVAVAAVAVAEKYRRSGGWGWLLLAGTLLAASLSLKILPVYAVPFVGLIVAARYFVFTGWFPFWQQLWRNRWRLGRDLLLLAGSFLLVLLGPALWFEPASLFDQVVAMRLVSRQAQLNPAESNNRDIVNFVFGQPGLSLLALYGLVWVVARHLRRYWLLLVWLGLVWVSMYFHVPLRGKHFPIFLPPLALFAGFALPHMLDYVKDVAHQSRSLRTGAMWLLLLLVWAMVGWQLRGLSLDPAEAAEAQPALDFIQMITTPEECVVADDPVFLYHTHHLPPPELAETSRTRIETGYLTRASVIQSLEQHNCPAVAIVTPRFDEELPGLTDWLAQTYLGRYTDGETTIYFAKKDPPQPPISVAGGTFGKLVRLFGLEMNPGPWAAGETAYMSLFWELEAPLSNPYEVRLTLRDAQGQPVLHHTRPLFEGHFDPARWQVAERVRDTFWLPLPADLPPGPYTLHLSLCQPAGHPCLPLEDGSSPGLKVGQVTISP